MFGSYLIISHVSIVLAMHRKMTIRPTRIAIYGHCFKVMHRDVEYHGTTITALALIWPFIP